LRKQKHRGEPNGRQQARRSPFGYVMADHINKSNHWLARAAEMRAIALPMADDGIKASMLKLASDYDKLAARAIARAGAKDVGP
jgi:hypothetical protein